LKGGLIETSSTATATSKFGVPFEQREKILKCFSDNPWISGIHCHVGSQGCDFQVLTSALKETVSFAIEINQKFKNQIKFIV
jgi:diaminopimelate decarboxylase